MSERRRHTRVSVEAYVAATLISEDVYKEKVFMGSQISPEGIFLVTKEILPIGSLLTLEVHTATTAEPVKMEAKVVRVAKDENSQPLGMGLVFTKISDQDRRQLFRQLYLAYHYVKPQSAQGKG